MKILQKGRDEFTPSELIEQADSWLKTCEILSTEAHYRTVPYQRLFALGFAIELLLKSLLVLQDEAYASTKELKKCEHNILHIAGLLKKEDYPYLRPTIITLLHKYPLFELKNWHEITRYPTAQLMLSVSRNPQDDIEAWKPVFQSALSIVGQKSKAWENIHFPRKYSFSLMTSGEMPKDQQIINKVTEEILDICPACRPTWILSVHRHVTHPWSIPPEYRLCKTCDTRFLLKKTWVKNLDDISI